MRKICFVGGMDKLDLIVYTASIIHGCSPEQKNCLVVDLTVQQKARYIIPSIELPGESSEKYLTTYQGIDIAVGFNSYDELVEADVLESLEENVKKYELVFFNVDSKEGLEAVSLDEGDIVFLTTTMDIYSIEKAVEAFSYVNVPTQIHRIIFGKKVRATNLQYISYLLKDTNITFSEYIVPFPYDNGDLTIIHENQMARRLNMKPFSSQFKSSLAEVCEIIAPELARNIGRYIKVLEKN